jgi:hypothetical protein
MSARPPEGLAPPVVADLVARYEALRHGIVDGAGWPGGLGLAVLRREGLAAWIAAWAMVPAPAPAAAPAPPDFTLRLAAQRRSCACSPGWRCRGSPGGCPHDA